MPSRHSRSTLVLLAFLAACASHSAGSLRFAPSESGATAPSVLTYPALRAYARDVAALRSAGGAVVGELSGERDYAAEQAARHGATHYVWVGSEEETRSVASLCWQRPALPAAPVATSCRPSSEVVLADRFVLVRVPPAAWPELPEGLRPRVRLPELPPSCRCSANLGGREIWCDGKLYRASAPELDAHCTGR